MKGWANLQTDLWKLIPLWDGRTVAYARAVCKKWRRGIDQAKQLMHLLTLHFVRLEDASQLEEEFMRNYPVNAKFKRVSSEKAAKITDRALWEDCTINRYRLEECSKWDPFVVFVLLSFLDGLAKMKRIMLKKTHKIY
jgi:hypothetical protein